ncbi:Fumarylacetoacetase [Sphaceloma murrayae]|uniref:Fumarylacetoacetase n=1 Tax=Sphaceloma murrayae TaxID=2082308 RepID=A0A2K1QQD5_9PEZI|nr:Fumarylacetoacetase [Sphaceloma murrayae]
MAASADFADHFGIENIPFGIASSSKRTSPQAVTRHENKVIFLSELPEVSKAGAPAEVFTQPTLNAFGALGRSTHKAVRAAIQQAIKSGSVPDAAVEDVSAVKMHLPMNSGDFTDFSCSPHHNRRAGRALLGQSGSLPPAFHNQPLGYAGRCSSIVVSGTPVVRPMGQFFEYGIEGLQGKRTNVRQGPCRNMDYEMEMGVIIGKPVPYGTYVTAEQAKENVFGFVLLNDWSARDIQQFEMIPVGPLNSKHSATSISPWVVTPDALEPFKVPTKKREIPIAPYLDDKDGARLNVRVQVAVAKDKGAEFKVTGYANTDVMDWTFEQLVSHQSSAGAGLRTGDMMGIGTISGAGDDQHGCLLEEFVPGHTPARGYVEDQEVVQIQGFAGPGVGFGECVGQLVPAINTAVWQN